MLTPKAYGILILLTLMVISYFCFILTFPFLGFDFEKLVPAKLTKLSVIGVFEISFSGLIST